MAAKTKYALGVDLGGTNIKLGIVSDSGTIISKLSVPSNADKGPKEVIRQIKSGINQILSRTEFRIKGIGIGAPGTVSLEKGSVESPPNLPGWTSIKLGKIIEKEFNLKTRIENDANAAAIGEMIFGAGKKFDSFVMITLGTGVGSGIIINKKIYRGEYGAAGEIGHMSIDFNGPECNCGSIGCIEAYVGNNYLKQRVINQLEAHPDTKILELVNNDTDLITPIIIREALVLNDDFALSVVNDMGLHIGAVLASVSNMLDICTFIIGGGVAGLGEPLFSKIRETAAARVLTPIRKRVKVLPAKLKNDAGVKGSSALVFYKP